MVQKTSVNPPPVSAQKPSTGLSFVIFMPIVFTTFHPPAKVPREITEAQMIITQKGT